MRNKARPATDQAVWWDGECWSVDADRLEDIIRPALACRGASAWDLEDVAGNVTYLLVFGRARHRTRDLGPPLALKLEELPPEARHAWLQRLAVREWLALHDWTPERKALRQLVAEVLASPQLPPAPEAPPLSLRSAGRFDRRAVQLAVAWFLGQPGYDDASPGSLTKELLQGWRFEMDPGAEPPEEERLDDLLAHIDGFKAAEKVFPTLDWRERRLLALLGRGASYRDVAAALCCGIGTVSRALDALLRRLCEAADQDPAAAAVALGMLKERCAERRE